jgi:hypothetical protein
VKEVNLDLFEPFDALIPIEVLGRTLDVPENNCLLRALQFVAGDMIASGRFCWNDECGNCQVTCVAPESGGETPIRACQARVYPGMKITAISAELRMDLE